MKPLPVITAATTAAALDPAISAALEAVNGRACSFAITGPRVVRKVAAEVEAQLERNGVPKALRVGTVVVFIPAGPAAKAYKHVAKSTRITLRRFARGEWRLMDVAAAEVRPKQAESTRITISADAAEAVRRHAMRAYSVAAAS